MSFTLHFARFLRSKYDIHAYYTEKLRNIPFKFDSHEFLLLFSYAMCVCVCRLFVCLFLLSLLFLLLLKSSNSDSSLFKQNQIHYYVKCNEHRERKRGRHYMYTMNNFFSSSKVMNFQRIKMVELVKSENNEMERDQREQK